MLKAIAAILVLSLLALPARAEQIVISQFGKEKFLLYLPLYVAMEEGFFAKRGLEVVLKFAGNDDQIFASVMSGEADIGVGDPVFAAIAKEKGFPGRVVAEMVKKLGLTGLAKRNDIQPVKTLADLSGRTICSLPSPSTTFTLLSEMLEKNSIENTKIVQVAIGSQVAALASGRCDIALDLEPGATIAESNGLRSVFSFDSFTVPMTITGFQTTQKVIDRKPQVIQAAVTALQEAILTLQTNPEAALRTTRRIFPNLSDEIVRGATKRMMDLNVYPSTVVVEDDSWQRTLKVRLESGQLKHSQRLEDSVDNSFALNALKELRVKEGE